MPISKEKLKEIIQNPFPDSETKITDRVRTGDHYEIEIKDQMFKGKNKLDQHRLVNSVLKGVLKGDLHALTIKTTY